VPVVAIIPARGGSKGVPAKNLQEVGGISLVARAVAAAWRASRIDRVIVSTDDEAIAAAARAAGAEVMARPERLATDTASSESALLHVLEHLAELTAPAGSDLAVAPAAAPPAVDTVVFIQATSPFIDPAALDDAIARVRSGAVDVVFSAVRTHAFLWENSPTGAIGVNHDPTFRPRRQDREQQFRETGAFYVMDAAGFRSARFRFFGRVEFALVDDVHGLEIDTAHDLLSARALFPLAESAGAISTTTAPTVAAASATSLVPSK